MYQVNYGHITLPKASIYFDTIKYNWDGSVSHCYATGSLDSWMCRNIFDVMEYELPGTNGGYEAEQFENREQAFQAAKNFTEAQNNGNELEFFYACIYEIDKENDEMIWIDKTDVIWDFDDDMEINFDFKFEDRIDF